MAIENVTRRRVLHGIAGGTAATGLAGKAFAQPPERKIVGLEPDADFGVARRRADDVHRELDFGRIGKAVAGKFPEPALQGLENNPNVRYVEEDQTAHALAQTLPWGVDRVDADVVHNNGNTGSGADIAIIDTGIDADHPDLQANLGTGKDFTGTGSWDDDNGHGTHCAGIADAVNNSEGVVGVSTEATLHAAKVLGSGGSGSFSDIAAAIQWVANQGYDVGSMSLGASSGNSTLQSAVQYAQNNGVLLVAAAGNSGPCSSCVGYPAAYPEVMAVSSTNNNDNLSSFSSTGSQVEIAAPGSDVYSTYMGGGYDTLSGTSMACPHVSGAAGQLMAQGASNSSARSTLKNTAENIGLSSNESGSGLLDVEAAISGGGGGGFSVSTGSASSIGENSATLNGTLDNLDGASSADVHFEWRQTGASSWSTTSTQTLSSTGSFSDSISGLTKGTGYEFRAVGNASDGDSNTGGTVTFATDGDCVDATTWPAGSGSAGAENFDQIDLDGQVVKTSAANAYEDFTCPDVVTVSQGGSFDVSIDFSDGGFDNHYCNVYVDWDQNGDWSTATEYQLFSGVSNDSTTYTGTINVPSSAATGTTLVRVRLSWYGFDGPSATGEYGEVNDFTVDVQ